MSSLELSMGQFAELCANIIIFPTFGLYTFDLCWASSSKSERESQPKSANVLW